METTARPGLAPHSGADWPCRSLVVPNPSGNSADEQLEDSLETALGVARHQQAREVDHIAEFGCGERADPGQRFGVARAQASLALSGANRERRQGVEGFDDVSVIEAR